MDATDKKIMSEQIEQIVDAQKLLLANDELFKCGAKICMKSYTALMCEGFTRDEAIRIVAGGGMAINKGK